MSENTVQTAAKFDLGHQENVDRHRLAKLLTLTPTQRLDRHESWRVFLREAMARARFSQRDDQHSRNVR
jgi:hypothetical protein